MFINEKEMQDWLSESIKNNDGLGDLVINCDYLKEYQSDSLINKRVYQSFKYCLESLSINEILSENENISLNIGDILKPDFLLYAPETESIVIVEIKNDIPPTRQAGTELMAYASEVRSYIPFISEGDIVNVIISTKWPVLLKHYIFYEIFWLQRNVVCLEPIERDDEKRLKIVDISVFINDDVSINICPKHLGGYQLCLYDDELYKLNHDKNRLDNHLEQMKTALDAIATKGYSNKNHGFAFLWKDHLPISLAPYSITILNFIPFNSIERLLKYDEFLLNKLSKKFIDVIKEYSPGGHGQSLWEITKAGNYFLDNFCSPRQEGFLTWDILKNIMLERGALVSFRAWGMFGELFSEKLKKEYKNGNININATDPNLGLELLNEIIDDDYDFWDLTYWNFEDDLI